jgi:hypothetical protein
MMAAMQPRIFADVAPGPAKYAFLGFGALVMAIPAGLALGTLAYLVLARGKPEEPDERDLPLWGKKLWRRSVRTAVIVIFGALVMTALVASAVNKRL